MTVWWRLSVNFLTIIIHNFGNLLQKFPWWFSIRQLNSNRGCCKQITAIFIATNSYKLLVSNSIITLSYFANYPVSPFVFRELSRTPSNERRIALLKDKRLRTLSLVPPTRKGKPPRAFNYTDALITRTQPPTHPPIRYVSSTIVLHFPNYSPTMPRNNKRKADRDKCRPLSYFTDRSSWPSTFNGTLPCRSRRTMILKRADLDPRAIRASRAPSRRLSDKRLAIFLPFSQDFARLSDSTSFSRASGFLEPRYRSRGTIKEGWLLSHRVRGSDRGDRLWIILLYADL